jgi:ATP-binding cassette subfamily B protein
LPYAFFRNIVRTISLVAHAGRGLVFGAFAWDFLEAGTVIAFAWVGKCIIDAVVAANQDPAHGYRRAVMFVVLEAALGLVMVGAREATRYTDDVLRSKAKLYVSRRILEKALNVSYARFEDPKFLDGLAQARLQSANRPTDVVLQLSTVLRFGVQLAGCATLLVAFGPLAVLALVVSAALPLISHVSFGKKQYEVQLERTERNRKAGYFEQLVTTAQSAKEIKLFALGAWVLRRFDRLHDGYHREEETLASRRAKTSMLLGIVASCATYSVYTAVVIRAVRGEIGIGSMTLFLMVMKQGSYALQNVLTALGRVYSENLFLSQLFDFLAVPEDEPYVAIDPGSPATSAANALPLAPPKVEFQGVSFRYPGAAKDSLTDIDLVIRPGETMALVGKNGAGKTTLVKLLVGLYRPTKGRILFDGVDVATMTPAALRERIGVIFQDFVKYEFTAGDNVGVGWEPSVDDEAAIAKAVDDADATAEVARLPNGMRTLLGRAFGGSDLSGGQWQRLALARAFMRRSRFIVLDEPTAALDPEAEHATFQRLAELRAGRTALLITHRFSTIRTATRIVVFEDGRVIEEGSHLELLAACGVYARLFQLQAKAYDVDGVEESGEFAEPKDEDVKAVAG